MLPKRLVHTSEDINRIAEERGEDPALIEREFVLMTVAAHLCHEHPTICLKGGFPARHVHGQLRFSKDVDSTQTDPPKKKIDTDELRDTIENSVRGLDVTLSIPEPTKDNKYSVSFEDIKFNGLSNDGEIAVEVSYREGLADKPLDEKIGPPYYELFPAKVMSVDESVAEKMRCLAQRALPTDLADAAFYIKHCGAVDANVARIVPVKFKPSIVKGGSANRVERILSNIEQVKDEYERTIPKLVENYMPYDDAVGLVQPKLKVYFSKI